MKITVTVDLAEFYTEEEGQSFSNEIKNEIASKIKNQVWKDFELKALSEMKQLVTEEFEKSKSLNINSIVEKILKNKQIKKKENNSEMITIEEYITKQLTDCYFSERNSAEQVMKNQISSFEDKFQREIKNTSDTIGKELKDRYDLLFASQIVSKLNENGMLKIDVAKLLLNSENES
jgi:hypothetical protein